DVLRQPIIEYRNAGAPGGGLGIAVVGGFVYRGSAVRQLRGRYVFGDFSRGFAPPDGSLFVAKPRKQGLWRLQEVRFQGRPGRRLGHYLLGIGQDATGELYVLTSDVTGPRDTTGRVYRLVRPGKGRP